MINMEINMISVQVATCKAILASEVKDVHALLIVFSTLLFLALGFTLAGNTIVSVMITVILIAMIIPLADYYHKWQARLHAFIAATENVSINIDLDF